MFLLGQRCDLGVFFFVALSDMGSPKQNKKFQEGFSINFLIE